MDLSKVRTIIGSHIWIWLFQDTNFPQDEAKTNAIHPEENLDKFSEIWLQCELLKKSLADDQKSQLK